MADGGLSTVDIERCIEWASMMPGALVPQGVEGARAELAALIGRVAELTAQNAALREALAEFRVKLQEIEGVIAVLQRAHEVRGAAGARDDRMSFAAFVAWLGREGLAVCSSRGWDGQAWRPLEPTAVLARWLDALRAGGAGETETGG
jgi:hypothetical protein